MDTLIATLLAWIAATGAYDTTAMPAPRVVEMTPQELTQEFYADAMQLMPEDGVDDRINALFAHSDGPAGTIYIIAPRFVDDAVHFEDPRDNPLWREILLHELVHHAQWRSGTAATWACQSFGEREAYILGGRYLKQVHADDPMPNRMFWAQLYARC